MSFVGVTGVWLGSYFQPNLLNDINIWFISLAFLVLYVPFAHLIPFRKRFAQTGDYGESYFDSNTLFCVPFSVRPGNVCCITQK